MQANHTVKLCLYIEVCVTLFARGVESPKIQLEPQTITCFASPVWMSRCPSKNMEATKPHIFQCIYIAKVNHYVNVDNVSVTILPRISISWFIFSLWPAMIVLFCLPFHVPLFFWLCHSAVPCHCTCPFRNFLFISWFLYCIIGSTCIWSVTVLISAVPRCFNPIFCFSWLFFVVFLLRHVYLSPWFSSVLGLSMRMYPLRGLIDLRSFGRHQ